MGLTAIIITILAVAGAIASWIVGAVASARILAADGSGPVAWLSAAAWPFRLDRIRNAGGANAAVANKAIVAMIACITLAAATISYSTNINRFAK